MILQRNVYIVISKNIPKKKTIQIVGNDVLQFCLGIAGITLRIYNIYILYILYYYIYIHLKLKSPGSARSPWSGEASRRRPAAGGAKRAGRLARRGRPRVCLMGLIIKEPWATPDRATPKSCYFKKIDCSRQISSIPKFYQKTKNQSNSSKGNSKPKHKKTNKRTKRTSKIQKSSKETNHSKQN